MKTCNYYPILKILRDLSLKKYSYLMKKNMEAIGDEFAIFSL